jgi:hypothetical protein
MFSAQRCSQVLALFLILGSTGSQAGAQSPKLIGSLVDSGTWLKQPPTDKPCAPATLSPLGWLATTGKLDQLDGTCENSPPKTPSVPVLCDPTHPANPTCSQADDVVAVELGKMAKPGQKILNARQQVLQILVGQNTCSEWYRLREPDPAATFRTIHYALDGQGEEFVHETRESVSETIYRNPYVASVIQDAGVGATITINPNGAFFRFVGPTIVRAKEGGTSRWGGVKTMGVGPYPGESLKAQILTLLHEFGHILGLLPIDYNNVDGKSMQNSIEVLRYCRAQIETPARLEKPRAWQ